MAAGVVGGRTNPWTRPAPSNSLAHFITVATYTHALGRSSSLTYLSPHHLELRLTSCKTESKSRISCVPTISFYSQAGKRRADTDLGEGIQSWPRRSLLSPLFPPAAWILDVKPSSWAAPALGAHAVLAAPGLTHPPCARRFLLYFSRGSVCLPD